MSEEVKTNYPKIANTGKYGEKVNNHTLKCNQHLTFIYWALKHLTTANFQLSLKVCNSHSPGIFEKKIPDKNIIII